MTPAMKETLDFVTRFWREKGYSPSLDEIAAARGLRSKGVVSGQVNRLLKAGLLVRTFGNHRSLEPANPLGRYSTGELRAEPERRERDDQN